MAAAGVAARTRSLVPGRKAKEGTKEAILQHRGKKTRRVFNLTHYLQP